MYGSGSNRGRGQPQPKKASRICAACGAEFEDTWRTRRHAYCPRCNEPALYCADVPATFSPDHEKVCRKCGHVKPLSEFYQRGNDEPGHHSWCKDCVQRDTRLRHPSLYKYGRPVTVTRKRCSTCGETKDPSEFSRAGRSKDGLAFQCKPCRRDYLRQRQGKPSVRWTGYVPTSVTWAKACQSCGLTKDWAEFRPDARRRDGLSVECEKCRRQRAQGDCPH